MSIFIEIFLIFQHANGFSGVKKNEKLYKNLYSYHET